MDTPREDGTTMQESVSDLTGHFFFLPVDNLLVPLLAKILQ